MKLQFQIYTALIFLLLSLVTINLFADDRTQSFESYVIESFDDDPVSRWVVRGEANFIADGYPKVAKVNTWPEALWGKNWDGKEYNVLGIKAAFKSKGYHYLEIIPATEAPANTAETKIIFTDANGKKWISNPISFKGRVQSFDVWVWGSNHNYYMEVHLQDHTGRVHVLPLGDLLFTGWKNLTAGIPSAIPQSEPYVPRLQTLKLIKLMMWTRPAERVSEFYLYLDHMKILTDLFESSFDGDDLQEPAFLNQIWGDTQ